MGASYDGLHKCAFLLGGMALRRRQMLVVMFLAWLVWLAATWTVFAAHTLTFTDPVSSSLIWQQAMPSAPPSVADIRTVRLQLSTSHTDGRIQAAMSTPLTRSDGAILPADRLVWALSPSGPYNAFPATNLYSFSTGTSHSITVYLGIILQDGDPIGIYSGDILFEYVWRNNSQAKATLSVSIEINPWIRLTYLPNPVPVSSPTGGMYDDLVGQVDVSVAASGQWAVQICASGTLTSAQAATLAPDQVLYRLAPAGSWVPLSFTWTPLTAGSGQAAFSIEFRVTNPFSRRSGLYAGVFQLRATPL